MKYSTFLNNIKPSKLKWHAALHLNRTPEFQRSETYSRRDRKFSHKFLQGYQRISCRIIWKPRYSDDVERSISSLSCRAPSCARTCCVVLVLYTQLYVNQ